VSGRETEGGVRPADWVSVTWAAERTVVTEFTTGPN
jgi:hypothetical protein